MKTNSEQRSGQLNNIQVVLVRAENSMNIGQTARAMKNFGFLNLSLVKSAPHQTDSSYTLGWKAKDVLDRAKCFGSLSSALQGSELVIGFTGRSGRKRGESKSVYEILDRILEVSSSGKVALLFGNEKNGLSNEEINFCHEIAFIPASPRYSSLNLSHAVCMVAGLIYNSISGNRFKKKPERFYATHPEFEQLMKDFKTTLFVLKYHESPKKELSERTLENIRRFFVKSGLEKREYHLFRAFLAKILIKKEPK